MYIRSQALEEEEEEEEDEGVSGRVALPLLLPSLEVFDVCVPELLPFTLAKLRD